MYLKYIAILFLFIIIFTTKGFSQTLEARKYELAKNYEQNGDLENAARLYLELAQNNLKKDAYLEDWARTIKELNKYTDYLDYLKERIQQTPNLTTNILLGEAYWLKGFPNEANDAWDKAKKLAKTKEDFLFLTQSLFDLRQYDKVRDIFLEARKEMDNPNIFADELSKIYTLLGDYSNAVNEILINYNLTRNISLTEGRLYALMLNQQGKETVRLSIETRLAQNPNNIELIYLYVWFLRSVSDYNKAFDEIVIYDKLVNANFREILNFAQQSLNDNQFDVALKSYSYIIDNAKNKNFPSLLASALYGFARTMQQKAIFNSTLSKDNLNEIKDIYSKMIKQFPNTTNEYDAYYQLALISMNYDKDNEKAIDYLNKITAKFGLNEIFVNSQFTLADLYAKTDNLDKSLKIYAQMLNAIPAKYSSNYQEIVDKANFKIAKIYYYENKFDSTNVYLNKINIASNTTSVNDALELKNFLTTNSGYTKALEIYSQSEFLEFKKDYKDAIAKYNEAAEAAEQSDLAQQALMKIANIHFNLNQYEQSIDDYKAILDKFPNTIFDDFIYFEIGKEYNLLGKTDDAVENLTKIIMNHPKSIYYEDARKLIREIRNKKEKS
jgi:tetratricopeptide (TPR) repeat protein